MVTLDTKNLNKRHIKAIPRPPPKKGKCHSMGFCLFSNAAVFFTLVPEVRSQNTQDEINHANGLLTLSRRKEKKPLKPKVLFFVSSRNARTAIRDDTKNGRCTRQKTLLYETSQSPTQPFLSRHTLLGEERCVTRQRPLCGGLETSLCHAH